MKRKLSISIEDSTIALVENIVKDSRFRNKSHLIEHSVELFLKDLVKEEAKKQENMNLEAFHEELSDPLLLKEKYHITHFNKKWQK